MADQGLVRIARVRLWILPVFVVVAGMAVKLLDRFFHVSEVADDRAVRLTFDFMNGRP